MHAGQICLILVAAQAEEDLNATIAYFLDHLGWLDGDGVPMSTALARAALRTWPGLPPRRA